MNESKCLQSIIILQVYQGTVNSKTKDYVTKTEPTEQTDFSFTIRELIIDDVLKNEDKTHSWI